MIYALIGWIIVVILHAFFRERNDHWNNYWYNVHDRREIIVPAPIYCRCNPQTFKVDLFLDHHELHHNRYPYDQVIYRESQNMYKRLFDYLKESGLIQLKIRDSDPVYDTCEGKFLQLRITLIKEDN